MRTGNPSPTLRWTLALTVLTAAGLAQARDLDGQFITAGDHYLQALADSGWPPADAPSNLQGRTADAGAAYARNLLLSYAATDATQGQAIITHLGERQDLSLSADARPAGEPGGAAGQPGPTYLQLAAQAQPLPGDADAGAATTLATSGDFVTPGDRYIADLARSGWTPAGFGPDDAAALGAPAGRQYLMQLSRADWRPQGLERSGAVCSLDTNATC